MADDKFDRLVNAIEAAEAESYGAEGMDGSLSDERAAAINAYFGVNTNPAAEGNSQVVSRDVFDTIEWITPSLVRIFAGTDEVVKFEPISKEDEPGAKQETLYVNHVVTQRNQWTQVFHDWVKDALLTKNAYCMAYWDSSKQVEYETYAAQSDDAFALLMEDVDEAEILEHTAEVDADAWEQIQAQHAQAMQQWQMMAMQAGQQWQQAAGKEMAQGMPPPQPPELPPQPQLPPQPMLHAVKLRRTNEAGHVCLKVLPPERCVVHQHTPDYTLNECDFFEYWEEKTISSLRSMGFDIEDDIDADSKGNSDTEESGARDRFGEDQSNGEGWEPAMRKVRTRMCWIRHDHDDDGIAELQFCIVVGRKVLYRDECNRIPVGSIVATPVPHRHVGISVAEVVMEIAETKQAMLRQGIDNLFHANNPRLFVNDGKINLDDALVSRPGGMIRGMQGEQAEFGRDIAPIVIPNIFPQAVQGMEYMDRLAERRTGVNGVFSGNVSPEVLTQTTGMAMSQMGNAAAQKVEQIARMIAPSVEYLFGCVHELILKHGHKKDVVRLAGEWVTIDPSNWKRRKDLKIAVGLGSGNKDTVLAHLSQMFQMQMALLPMGVTEPKLIYNTVAEISKMAGFGSPDMFWKTPGPPQPQPPPPEIQKEQMRLQGDAQKFQAQQQAEQAKRQDETAFEAQKLQIEVAEKDKDRAVQVELARMAEATKLAIANLNRETTLETTQSSQAFEAEKMGATFQREDMKESAKEQVKDDGMSALLGNVQEAIGTLHERIEGSQTVGLEKVRDKTGKMIGARIRRADGSMREVQIQ